MSKLPSFSYREVAAKLRRAGFVPVRTGKHDVYVNKAKNVAIPLPHHIICEIVTASDGCCWVSFLNPILRNYFNNKVSRHVALTTP